MKRTFHGLENISVRLRILSSNDFNDAPTERTSFSRKVVAPWELTTSCYPESILGFVLEDDLMDAHMTNESG